MADQKRSSATSMVEMKSPAAAVLAAAPSKELRSSSAITMNLLTAAEARSNEEGVTGCVQALFTTLSLFGLQDNARDKCVPPTIKHWVRAANMIGAGGWMKWAKYKFAAYFFAHTVQLDVPVPPPLPPSDFVDSPKILCNGQAGRWLNTLVRKNDALTSEILASVLQIKKGCPRPGKDIVDASVESTRISLTSTQPPKAVVHELLDWADIGLDCPAGLALRLDRPGVEQQLRRTVRELFMYQTYTWQDRLRPIFPSVSSTNDSTRAEGGQFRNIRDIAEAIGVTRYSDDDPLSPSFIQMRAATTPLAENEEKLESKDTPRYECDARELERKFGQLYLSALKLAEIEEPIATPVGLAESLKVRVITKGPPATMFVLKPLQKKLWDVLSKHKTFSLIAQPVTARLVQDAIGAHMRPGEANLSGDYSNATNELAPWVSNTIADELSAMLKLTLEERAIFIRALTGHFIGKDGVHHPQLWGQLMGSVVSFPVLCIANAALCRWAIEVSQQRIRLLRDCPLLINGDDCLFRTDAVGLRVWKQITSFSGLLPSIGKFFFTRQFAQINSVNFRRRDSPKNEPDERGVIRPLWYEATPYVNLGLLLGLKRSGEKLGTEAIADSRSGLGTRCRELIAAAPKHMSPALLRAFVTHHKAVLDASKLTPWFLPESYGGVGLPLVLAPRIGVQPDDIDDFMSTQTFMYKGLTRLDRQIAARILEDPVKYPVGRLPAESAWDIHRIVAARLPAKPTMHKDLTPEAKKTMSNVYSRVYGLLAVDALFTARDVMKETDTERMHRVLRRNERTFIKITKGGKLPPPLSIATIMSVCPDKPMLAFDILSINDVLGEPVS